LAEQFSARLYCLKCRKYEKILDVTDHPHYRLLEYTLQCGHRILERKDLTGFPFDDADK